MIKLLASVAEYSIYEKLDFELSNEIVLLYE